MSLIKLVNLIISLQNKMSTTNKARKKNNDSIQKMNDC